MILDLFAGMGGVAEGLRFLGLREVGVELDATACATRHAAGHRTVRADVTTLVPWRLRGRIEGLWASPPCQDWSRAGKRQGLATDRGRLVYEPLRWVEHARPKWVALEQVEDVLDVWRELAWRMRAWGYQTWVGVLNAADFGVPQTRRRAILMASRVGKVRPPAHTHSDQRRGGSLLGLAPWVSMAEALGWDGQVATGMNTMKHSRQVEDMVPYERETERPAPVVRSTTMRWKVRTTYGQPTDHPKNGSHEFDPAARPSHAVTGKARSWAVQPSHGSLDTSAPAPTLVTTRRSTDGLLVGRQLPEGEGRNVGGWGWERPATTVQGDPRVGRPGHKDREQGEGQFDHQAVRITLAEALVLQGFRPDYPVQGTKTKRFEQVGNAVPPPLAAAIVGVLTGIEREAVA